MNGDLRERMQSAVDAKNATVTDGYKDGSEQGFMNATLLPHATSDYGGSPAFNPNKPYVINVDPDIPGQSYSFDPNKLGKQKGKVNISDIPAEGYSKSGELRKQAADRFKAMIAQEQEGDEFADPEPAKPAKRRRRRSQPEQPKPEESAQSSEQPKPAESAQSSEQPRYEEKDLSPKHPDCRVSFNMGSDFGKMDCFYHRVFQDGICLVLIWDVRYRGPCYTPPMNIAQAIQVEIGQARREFDVFVGPSFLDEEHEERVTILFIQEGE